MDYTGDFYDPGLIRKIKKAAAAKAGCSCFLTHNEHGHVLTCRNYDLVAKWSPLTYQIAYNANAPKGLKAKGKMPGQKMTFGMEDSMLLRANAFTLDGYTFQGWTTDPASTEVEFDDEGQFSFGEGGYKKKVTLYAVWDK